MTDSAKRISLILCALAIIIAPTSPLAETPTPNLESLYNQGLAAFHGGDMAGALVKWREGLAIAEQHGAPKLISAFSANIGLAYAGLGDYESALAHQEKALAIHTSQNDKRNAAICLNNIGAAHKSAGQRVKALYAFQQSLALRLEIGDRRGEALTLLNIGQVHADAGQYKDAFQHIEQAVAIYETIRDQEGLADALKQESLTYASVGAFAEAFASCGRALDICRAINAPRKNAQAAETLGVIHLMRADAGKSDTPKADNQKAADYFTEALNLLRKGGSPGDAADALCNLGVAHKGLGRLKEAMSCYQEALHLKRSLGDKPNEGALLGNIGLVREASGDHAKALADLTESHRICMAFDLPEYQWRALRGLGKVETALQKYEEAESHYLKAIDIIENMRGLLSDTASKASFMEPKIHVYDELIALYLTLDAKHPGKGYDRRSLEMFERRQGRVFLEEMGKCGARKFVGVDFSLLADQERLFLEKDTLSRLLEAEIARPANRKNEAQIQALREKIAGLDAGLETIRQTLKKDHPAYYTLAFPGPASLKTLQNETLSSGEMILVYNLMKDDSCVWAIAKDHFSATPIPEEDAWFAKAVAAFRNQDINVFKGQVLRGNAEKPQAAAPGDASGLYAALFPPAVAAVMGKHQTIYIVPTGALYLLPFEALKTPGGQYLIENHAVAYLSSASLLHILRTIRKNQTSPPHYPFLAFANPVYETPAQSGNPAEDLQVRSFYSLMRGSIAPLPETEEEVTQIKNILKAPEASQPLQIQKNASRTRVLDMNARGGLDDYRYLSFACHGIIPDDTTGILQPSLLLSTPDPLTRELGLLTMADVFKLSLNAELVALSACNTGRGEMVRGEGVMGLTRAFMYAGTPAVTVNLWSVETVSAQTLNVSCFEKLEQGVGRAEALRASKLKLLKGQAGSQFQQPFFWAPTVLFGDGD